MLKIFQQSWAIFVWHLRLDDATARASIHAVVAFNLRAEPGKWILLLDFVESIH